MFKRKYSVFLALFWSLFFGFAFASGYVHLFYYKKSAFNPQFYAEGRELYLSSNCQSCHGDDGSQPSLPNYPKVKGQQKDYLVQQLKAIQSGSRSSGASSIMKPFLSNLKEEELNLISYYLSKAE